MRSEELLIQIRRAWIQAACERLASETDVRASFEPALERFYDLLIEAVRSDAPEKLNPIIDEWVEARPRSDPEAMQTSITPLFDQFLLLTYEVSLKLLSDREALELLASLIPIHTYTYSYAAKKETQAQIEQISSELESARLVLEQLDQSKSKFISIAAHELKTPLTLIQGYASMLRERISTDEFGRVESLLNGIDLGARRLAAIVDDMIDVSLIDNNLLALTFQPIWLNRLFDLVKHEFESAMKERQIEFEVHDFPGFREMIFADGERLYQAFRNLISNAFKYTPDRGRIWVDGRLLPGFIEVTITDTGIGINPEDQMRIFDKFGQVGNVSLHSSGKTKFKGGGPGLGLPITKGIIEAHGGAIWVESEGHDEERCPGTTFHVLLPIRAEPPDEKFARLFKGEETTSLKGEYKD